MNKNLKKIIIISIVLLIVGLSILVYRVSKVVYEPSVNLEEKKAIKKYVERYLSNKYGKHEFKVTDVEYQYHMTTLFDYSNPTGYWVYFKSNVVPKSWVTINGLKSQDYKVNSDYFIEDYYFPDKDAYDIYETMNSMKPKKELESIFLKIIHDEFEPNTYEVQCNTIILDIPEDFGRIPTLEELKTNTNLYKVTQFDYKVSNKIDDISKYKERLKSYINNKYNCNSNIYINSNNTISVYLES